MAKASAKQRNSPYEAEIKLYKQWSTAVTPVSIYTVRIIDDIFKTVKKSIASKISFETGNDRRLPSYDEKIYQFYRELMDIYRGLAEETGKDGVLVGDKAEKVRDIWNGIFAVIQSRLKLFEENTAEIGGFASNKNPVVIEKKAIVSNAIKAFSESFYSTEQRFKIENRKRIISDAIKSIITDNEVSVYDGVLEQIKDPCFKMFYDFYSTAVQSALIGLNDFYNRRDVRYYYELLIEEQQILSSIINIQAAVLENEISDEGDALLEAVTVLKQANEQLNFKVQELDLLFKSVEEKREAIEEFDAFSADIGDKLTKCGVTSVQYFKHAKNTFKNNHALFLKNLEVLFGEHLQKSVKNINGKGSLYECSKIIFEHEQLLGEIIAEFKQTVDFYNETQQLYEDNEHKDIIKGIAETVIIKIENLEENKEQLASDMTEMLSAFSNEKVEISEEERLSRFIIFRDMLTEKLLECLNEDRRGHAAVKAMVGGGYIDDSLQEYREKIARLWQKNIEKLNNKLLKFKRDSLLFEVSTFEEILNYSVPVLRGSEENCIIEFVSSIDENTKRLSDILVKYGIEIIKPLSHEAFNGKEHDVMVAETNPDFNRGEIIKVMNCGYKQNDVVILRANVIAAK